MRRRAAPCWIAACGCLSLCALPACTADGYASMAHSNARYRGTGGDGDIVAAVIYGAAAVLIVTADAIRAGVQDISDWFARQDDPEGVAWDSQEGLYLRGVRVPPEAGHPSVQ